MKKPNSFSRLPNKHQWFRFLRVLTRKEKIFFFIFLSIFSISAIFLLTNTYLKKTEIVPDRGGIHIEGVIGQPRHINPVYANSDTDKDLIQLVYPGLMKYTESMEVVPDLVQSYEISPDKKRYTFHLKENLAWEDKEPLTADDIVYTIKIIQDSAYSSPLRKNWVGIEVEKLGDLTIEFTLQQPYASFLENCTVKILPKHIWENISPENFGLEIYNLKPVAGGPYKVKEIKQDKPGNITSLLLTPNCQYHGEKPNIAEIEFLFFENQEELTESLESKKVKGVSLSSFQEVKDYQIYSLSFPRYFSLFFNRVESELLSQKEIRTALKMGTDKIALIREILSTEDSALIENSIVNSPILPDIYGFSEPENSYQFDQERSKEIIKNLGFEDVNGDGYFEKTIQKEAAFTFTANLQEEDTGTQVEELQKCLAKFPDVYPEGQITGYFGPKTEKAVINFQEKYSKDILEPWGFTEGTGLVSKTTRAKLNEVCFDTGEETIPLSFTIKTVEQDQMIEIAQILKEQWAELGFKVEIETFRASNLEQEVIKPRDYEALLFGEILGAIPDPFPFWHSSQKEDPGLNLALYENEGADTLLEENRKSSDSEIREEKLSSFQNLLLQEIPAIFLYKPPFIYSLSEEIKGFQTNKITEPSKRFVGIENWYIETKRAFK